MSATVSEGDGALAGRSILFLVTEDWYFVSHRLPVARAARDAGMTVHVATRVDRHGDQIRAEGFELHPLPWRRSGGGPLGAVRAIRAIRRLLQALRPDIMHAVALKAVVFGAIAARGLPTRPVFTIAGLGFAFTDRTPKAMALRTGLRAAFRLAVDRPDAVVILQNDDDRATLVSGGFVRRAALWTIRGSGIDVTRFAPLPPPEAGPPAVAVVSRMIAIKGVADLVAASRRLHAEGVRHRLLLVGEPDPANPSTIPAEVLRGWAQEPWIEWLGARSDVREVWALAHIAALTSRGGEGLPKTLLEAAACGRPILATDVPGIREIAVDGVTALMVPPGDVDAMSRAMRRLVESADQRERLGQAARERAAALFSEGRIVKETTSVYRNCCVR